ncbi:hypothetical protein HYV11_01295 [Candidatus Dependentiae bacterium]|nr:hypothetical protein [Candidatus Dependentiae bacterium]
MNKNVKKLLFFMIILLTKTGVLTTTTTSTIQKAPWDQEYGTALFNMLFYPTTIGLSNNQVQVNKFGNNGIYSISKNVLMEEEMRSNLGSLLAGNLSQSFPPNSISYTQPLPEVIGIMKDVYNYLDNGPSLSSINDFLPTTTSLPLTKALMLINSMFSKRDLLIMLPKDHNVTIKSFSDAPNANPLGYGVANWPADRVLNYLSPENPPLVSTFSDCGKSTYTAGFWNTDMISGGSGPLSYIIYGPGPDGWGNGVKLSYQSSCNQNGGPYGTLTITKSSTSTSDDPNKTYFYMMSDKARYGAFLSSSWLGSCASALGGTVSYSGMNTEFNFNDSNLSEIDQSYIKNHLIPALNVLNTKTTTTVDDVNSALSMNFDLESSDSVIITTIDNNTNMNFGIYQGGKQIGMLQPGVNQVALYGAAQAQGDIVFVSSNNAAGRFRISFKKGKDMVTIANTTASPAYSTDYPPNAVGSFNTDFLCVQITAADFVKGTNAQTVSSMQRTQCINLRQAKGPFYVTLKIEDNMTIVSQDTVYKIDQSNMAMYYPSIEKIVMPQNILFPYLVLPSSVASNKYISTFINFINIIMGVFNTNYTQIMVPSLVDGIVAGTTPGAAVSSHWIMKTNRGSEKDFGNIALSQKDGKNLLNASGQIVAYGIYAGLPGTQYLFTGDIPDSFEMDYAFQQPKLVSPSITTSNLTKVISGQAQSLWQQLTKGITVAAPQKNKEGKMVCQVLNANSLYMTGAYSIVNNDALIAGLSSLPTVSLAVQNASQQIAFNFKDAIAVFQQILNDGKNSSAKTYYLPVSSDAITISIPSNAQFTGLEISDGKNVTGVSGGVGFVKLSQFFSRIPVGGVIMGQINDNNVTMTWIDSAISTTVAQTCSATVKNAIKSVIYGYKINGKISTYSVPISSTKQVFNIIKSAG